MDIQGLRALAVVLVIVDHVVGRLTGGFIGVDVFFVISGFLITGLLLREHERTGRISFVGFYQRRIKRILPAALVVLAVTILAAWLIFTAARATSITVDAFWAAFFASNWHFAAIGTDYMNASGPVSPLQHYWSLSVEEQFYLVWPVVIIVILARAKGAVRDNKRLLLIALGLLVVTSFAWALWETGTNPTWAYFSTFSRAWELGIGAILAVAGTRVSTMPDRLRPVVAWVGLAAIAVGAVVLDTGSAFPAPWAILPVGGAALVIAAGAQGEQRWLWPLTNRLSTYVGDISYSLYLWHFPVYIFLRAAMPSGIVRTAITLLLTAALAVLSYHLIERPIHTSGWLTGAPRGTKHPVPRWVVIAAPLAIVVAVTGIAVQPPSVQAAHATTSATADTALGREQRAVVSAVNATAWPALSPAIDTLSQQDKATEWVQDGCLGTAANATGTPIANTVHCAYGDRSSDKIAVVFGDSIAISYVPAIRAALEPRGYQVRVMTVAECPAVDVTVILGSGQPHSLCNPFRDWAFDEMAKLRPDIVIATSSEDGIAQLADHPADPFREWSNGLQRTLDRLAGVSDRVFVLDPPPIGSNLQECATLRSHPSDCAASLDPAHEKLSRVFETVDAHGATHIRVTSWFCASNGICPGFIGTTPVTADGRHLTETMSTSLAPLVDEAIFGAG
jgi:peptidoglycan/LPS O-acetylase OafA/YrhL